VAIVLVVAVAVCMYRKNTINQFRYLGNVYNLSEGGSRGELNEECLQHPGYRMCQLTDGTPGVCALSGMCVADMEIDLRRARDEVPKPYCTAPIFKEGCGRFCDCLALAGTAKPDCIEDCRSWFSPI
jgi:hypothetical protein